MQCVQVEGRDKICYNNNKESYSFHVAGGYYEDGLTNETELEYSPDYEVTETA